MPAEAAKPESTTPAKIVYFCKDCKRIVEGKTRRGKKRYSFSCPLCNGHEVAYGTEKSIINYFRIKQADLREWGMLVEGEEKPAK